MRVPRKVLESDYEAQQNIAPFMEHKFLRRIIQTFCNDEQGDFGKWAKNPRVIEMLQHAKDLIDNGYCEEEELEHRMVEYLKNPDAEGHEQFDKKVNRKVNVESKDLVSALNEQCTLRHEGNLLYAKKNFEEAKEKYEQALSIMNLIKAADAQMGQFEIEQNKSFCLMNIASACIGMKDYGEVVERLNKVKRFGQNRREILSCTRDALERTYTGRILRKQRKICKRRNRSTRTTKKSRKSSG